MPDKTKLPKSYFFTESSFSQVSSNKSFGPINNNEFQITTSFYSPTKAFAVTSGTLFYAQCGDSTNLVNIIFKPINDLGLGIKVKYFVYRGIVIEEIFKVENGITYLKDDNTNLLNFLTTVWDEYTEFNQNSDNFTGAKIGYLDSTVTADDIVKRFFAKDKHNLLHVEEGTHIGTFGVGGGFEIVLDEGEFSQDQSDTGLVFNEKFARATECILKVDGEYPIGTHIFGGNTTTDHTIFRENVYKFLDPAAFYGMHALKSGTDRGVIKVGENGGTYDSADEIYNNIVSKFINANTVYLYIKSTRNRSYKFYKPETEKMILHRSDTTSSSSSWIFIPFGTNKWPLLIKSSFTKDEGFNIGSVTGNIVSSNFLLNEVHISATDDVILRKGKILLHPHAFTIDLPLSGGNNISNIVYLDFFDKSEFLLNNIFGNVNLNAILETEDVAGLEGSVITNLRPVLIQKGGEAAYYKTKVVLKGDYISKTNPSGTPTNTVLSTNLRTYILFPQGSTKNELISQENNVTAGYFLKPENADAYINKIYNKGEIWKGIIKELSNTYDSFSYQRSYNDTDMPVYQLGISQKEFNELLDRINDPTNIPSGAVNYFFCFDSQYSPADSSYVRYDLKIEYDTSTGVRSKTNANVKIYTVDGYFYFTKDYSANFKYFKEMADIAVDFLPIDLPAKTQGFEYGFDFIGQEINSAVSTYKSNRNRYTDLVGSYDITDSFIQDKRKFLNLTSRKYNGKPTNWRNGSVNDFPFHTDSFITLFPTKQVTVKLKFTKKTISETFTKLFIRYNKKYVSINNSPASPSATDQFAEFIIDKSNYESSLANNFNITIKSLQASPNDIPLEVFAVKGVNIIPAGKCWVRKNDKTYKLDVVIVNCKTKISGTGSVKEGILPGQVPVIKKSLENFLGQALIIPNLILNTASVPSGVPLELDLSSDSKFIPGTVNYLNATNTAIISTDPMFEHCINQLNINYPGPAYADKCTLFYFFDQGLSGTDPIGGEAYIKNGYVGGAYGARIFGGGVIQNTENTSAHELLHSIGLYHTFDNDGEYTFMKKETDNIMDYTKPDDLRKLVYYWQDEKVKNTNNNSKLKLVK